jgi:hypothetical protein
MDIEFTIDVQAGGAPANPRQENTQYFMASGIAGTLVKLSRSENQPHALAARNVQP